MAFCALLAVLWLVSAPHPIRGVPVINFNADALREAIGGPSPAAVAFTYPWCKDHTAILPELRRLADSLPSTAVIGVFDCMANMDLCEEHGLEEFPHLAVFTRGVMHLHSGPHTFPAMRAFVRKFLSGGLRLLPSIQEAGRWVGGQDAGLVGHFPSADHPDFLAFKTFAKEVETSGGHSFGVAALLDPNVPFSRVTLHKTYDVREEDLVGQVTVEALCDFLADRFPRRTFEIGPATYEALRPMAANVSVAFLFVDPRLPNGPLLADFARAAASHDGAAAFFYLDGPGNVSLAAALGLPGNVWPALAVEDVAGQVYPAPAEELTATGMAEFVADVIARRTAPFPRSAAAAPAPAARGTPHPVVGATFRSVVLDSPRDVLLLLHAPWCGYCKRAMSVFVDLAHRLQTTDSVLIVHMDGTQNAVPHPFLSTAGYPSIFLKDGGGAVTEYTGSLAAADVATFLLRNTRYPIEPALLLLTADPGPMPLNADHPATCAAPLPSPGDDSCPAA